MRASGKTACSFQKNNLIRDVRSEGKLVFINLTVKRYRCPYCGNIMSDKFTFYNMHGHITNRLREEFVRRCINGETFSYIAKDYQVDHKTVASAFKAYADSHKELLENNYTPEILGINSRFQGFIEINFEYITKSVILSPLQKTLSMFL